MSTTPFSLLPRHVNKANLWWRMSEIHAWIHDFKTGSAIGLVELDRDVFGAKPRTDLMYRALRYEESWLEQGTESSKALGQVRGTTKKPFPQKGRGRARQGTLRAPQFVGGYAVHGPRPHNKAIDIQKKVYDFAIRAALSTKFAQNQLIAVDSLAMDTPSRKLLAQRLDKLQKSQKRWLILYGNEEPEIGLIHAAENGTRDDQKVMVASARNVIVSALLENDMVLLDKPALEVLEEITRPPINNII